jgi:hypothetical protein
MADEKNVPQQPARNPSAAPEPRGAEEAARANEKARADARKSLAENVERERAERAERPQDVSDGKGKPTPTQAENDEIRAGLRHIDDKEDDGGGPDHAVRLDEARRRAMSGDRRSEGDYKTRR